MLACSYWPGVQGQLADLALRDYTIIFLTVELETIFRDESVWYAKSHDNISPNEPLHFLILDIGNGLSFNPFDEIISFDEELFMVSNCFWEWPNNI